eukprot:2859852-Pleurochrysis_carterae.AAC.1
MDATRRLNAGYGEADREAKRRAEVQRQVKEAFALFDKESKGTCDVREVCTIIRHLGICPTEIELRDMITEVRAHSCDEEPCVIQSAPVCIQLIHAWRPDAAHAPFVRRSHQQLRQ